MLTSKIVLLRDGGNGVDPLGMSSLTEVYAKSKMGDVVVVYPGLYDLGDNSIKLRDGVNWKFIGKPIITSSNSDGTFLDDLNNVYPAGHEFDGNPKPIEVHFDGDVIVVNTGGGYMFNLRNWSSNYGGSIITGYKLYIKGYVNDLTANEGYLSIYDTNFPPYLFADYDSYPFNISKESAGLWNAEFPLPFKIAPTDNLMNYEIPRAIQVWGDANLYYVSTHIAVWVGNTVILRIRVIDASGAGVDLDISEIPFDINLNIGKKKYLHTPMFV